jgi:hypothetical protein
MIRALKRFVGRGLMNWIHDANKLDDGQGRVSEGVYRFFEGAAPAVLAFEISNGFVVRTGQIGHIGELTFCADAPALAEHIVTSATKRKLGIQTDMFDKQQALSQSYHAAMAQTRSPRI